MCSFFSYEQSVDRVDEMAILRDSYQLLTTMDRTWMYQTCTEWGFMFSTNYGRNMYEDTFSVK